jgi:hypothetical protein
VPKRVNGIQMSKFNPSKFYTKEQMEFYVNKLKMERIEWLKQFRNLDQAIFKAASL